MFPHSNSLRNPKKLKKYVHKVIANCYDRWQEMNSIFIFHSYARSDLNVHIYKEIKNTGIGEIRLMPVNT